ncbi:hypothetical protein SAMN04488055_4689 [Chitinophaga niabensis]|uniref:Uncharacterized protein n=1 Tax=Chitinophaga niabensis TaxID=536979 RepID=A0A1N6JY88_9BACT|nr:hypothetical protein SAMN04488055_4689 [Chitinophaga niabensis]
MTIILNDNSLLSTAILWKMLIWVQTSQINIHPMLYTKEL